MPLALVNGRVITPLQVIENGSLLIGDDGRIASVGEQGEVKIPVHALVVDAAGGYVAPGFVDVHVHGGVGHDALDARHDGLRAMAAYHASHGTTALVPTLATAHLSTMTAAFQAVTEVQRQGSGGAEVLGVHLEGPFINTERKGAQPERHILAPSKKMVESLLHTWPEVPRIVTLAPERVPPEVIRLLREWGTVVAAGHTNASFVDMAKAKSNGVTQVTHFFNAMSPLQQRAPGVVGAVFTDNELRAELIADGLHVHPANLALAFRLLGQERIALVTDCISAGGRTPGGFRLSGQAVHYDGISVTLPDGTLAGSVLTMDRAVANMVQLAGCTPQQAVWMATLTPAQLLGLDGRIGCLEIGWDADVLLLDERTLGVRRVWLKGREHDIAAGLQGLSASSRRG